MNPSREVFASASRYPGQISWDYDRAEIIADGAVHAIGVGLGLIGAVTIVVVAVKMEQIEVTPILIYVIGLVTMLALSAAYNMWPISPAKWVLRRFDHSAIYLLIAGTYTPFLARFRADRRKLPLFGGPRLLAMGISGSRILGKNAVPAIEDQGWTSTFARKAVFAANILRNGF